MKSCEIVFTSPSHLGIAKETIHIRDLSSEEKEEIMVFITNFIKNHNERVK